MAAPYFHPDQLQAAVDAGQITQMQATNILSRQHAVAAVTGAQIVQRHAQRVQSAGQDVEQYLKKHPDLHDRESPMFRQVVQAAGEIATEFGMPADDYRVHRQAMRQVLAPKASAPAAQPEKPAPKDQLASVPKEHREYWERLGYTEQRMREEAKYIKPKRRALR